MALGVMMAPANADTEEVLVSPAGYRLVFREAAAPRLEAPDGTPVEGRIVRNLAGRPHWFKWVSDPSWRYDALRQWTGGANCCMWYWFVSKAPPYRALRRFDGGVDEIRLVDANGDGIKEFETLEDNYSFGTDTVHRTTPRLLWSMTDDGPVPARELMKAWLINDEKLESLRRNIAVSADNAYFGKWVEMLTTAVINQYYASGDLGVARSAFERLWPGTESEKEWWWARIVVQLPCSGYGVPGMRCAD